MCVIMSMCVDECMSVFALHMISMLIINVHILHVYVLENMGMCEYMCAVRIFIYEVLLMYLWQFTYGNACQCACG